MVKKKIIDIKSRQEKVGEKQEKKIGIYSFGDYLMQRYLERKKQVTEENEKTH